MFNGHHRSIKRYWSNSAVWTGGRPWMLTEASTAFHLIIVRLKSDHLITQTGPEEHEKFVIHL